MMQRGIDASYTHQGLCYRRETLSLDYKSFITDSKADCFFSRGGHYLFILDSNHACPLLQRETLSLSSKAIHYTSILNNIVQNVFAHKMCRNMRYHGYSYVLVVLHCSPPSLHSLPFSVAQEADIYRLHHSGSLALCLLVELAYERH